MENESFNEKYAKYISLEKRVDEIYHKIATQNGIADSVLWILYSLANPEFPKTQNEIALLMGVPKQTVNSAIVKLIDGGYVYLEQLPVARNAKKVLLTEKGEQFCKHFISPIVEAENKAFSRLTPEEQEIYLQIGIKHNGFLAEELQGLLEV